MKNDHNYGYFADLNHPNFTGRTLRESIGGTFSKDLQESKTIPVVAYVIALIAFVTLLSANFI
jgi:hypothetical protein